MVNWILTVNRPEYLENKALLVPKDKLTELLRNVLESDDWSISSSGFIVGDYGIIAAAGRRSSSIVHDKSGNFADKLIRNTADVSG